MKNYKLKLLLTCGLLSFLASCASDPETHQLIPVEKSIVLYADQRYDSLLFYTFDSWTVTPQVDWITVEGDSHLDIKYDYTKRYLCRVILLVKPNTTGKTRQGTVLVQSYEDYEYLAPVVQLGILNISHPAYTVDTFLGNSSIIPETAHFALTDSAHWTSDSICFSVQDNWDLKFVGEAPDWLSLDKTTDLPGRYKVNLTLTENTDTEHGRDAMLLLTSGEVANRIAVHQLPAKKVGE